MEGQMHTRLTGRSVSGCSPSVFRLAHMLLTSIELLCLPVCSSPVPVGFGAGHQLIIGSATGVVGRCNGEDRCWKALFGAVKVVVRQRRGAGSHEPDDKYLNGRRNGKGGPAG